jgi:hypothetical protein
MRGTRHMVEWGASWLRRVGSAIVLCACASRPTPPSTCSVRPAGDDLDELCLQPRRQKIVPVTGEELSRLLQGRWYLCGSAKERAGIDLPIPATWSTTGNGIEFEGSSWYLLVLKEDGTLARAEPKRPTDQLSGTFRVVTDSAWRKSMGQLPIPLPAPNAPGEPDWFGAVFQGNTWIQKIEFSESPRTMSFGPLTPRFVPAPD